MHLHRVVAVFCITAALGACSNAGLQPLDEQRANLVDDRLDIEGEVCTSPPKSNPFPVKVMFIVDASGSMQFTDPSNATASTCVPICESNGMSNCAAMCAGAENPGRAGAVQKVIDRFENNPVVSFSIIRFNSRVTVNSSNEIDQGDFTTDPATLSEAVSGLGEAEVLTDYQGALSTALQVLERDMVDTDPVERSRSKYVVIFLSDGSPNPQCQQGCGNDTQELAPGIIVDSWCDLPQADWCERDGSDGQTYVVTGEDCNNLRDSFPAMEEPCQQYNTTEDVIKKVREIMELGEQYGVGEIRLHTAFLWVDGLPQIVYDLFGLDKVESETLLQAMAKEGDGVYRSFQSGQSIDFLDINYTSVARPFGMTNFIVSNFHAIPAVNRLLVDSDADGIDDTTEFEASLARDNRDTDNDGYNDKLEYMRRNAGFDPNDPAKPVRLCPENERGDRDGDGLLDCEESIIGTDPKLADSDRDRIPDGIEFWFGTDPTEEDSKTDLDLDQKRTEDEIKAHSDPAVADPDIQSDFRYIYDVVEQPERLDLSRCYKFSVRRTRLVTTAQQHGVGTMGYNELLVVFGEGPVDDPSDYGSFKGACVRAQYVDQACNVDGMEDATCGYKNPANGKISLTPEDFYDLSELHLRRVTSQTDRNADPCVGVKMP